MTITVESVGGGRGIVRRDGRTFTLSSNTVTEAGMLDLVEAIAEALPDGYDVRFLRPRPGVAGAWQVFYGDTWHRRVTDVTGIVPAALAHIEAGRPQRLTATAARARMEDAVRAEVKTESSWSRIARRHGTTRDRVRELGRRLPRFTETGDDS